MSVIWIFLFLLSLALLVYSSDFFIEKAERIGLSLGISSFIVGVTIVAMGTSLPELATSLFAVLEGLQSGNSGLLVVPVDAIIGSNIANVLIVIGLASIWARSIKVTNKLIESDIPLLCMFTGVFVIFLYTDRVITRPEAYVSLLLFIVFLSYSIVTRSKHIFFTGHRPTFSHRDIAILVGAFFGVLIGGQLAVRSLSGIIESFGLEQFGVLTLVLLAVSTSLPEVIVSVQAARKRKFQIAIGNIFGSSVFNMLFVGGIAGAIVPLPVSQQAYTIGIPFLILSALAFVFAGQDDHIGRWEGIGFLSIYMVFILMIAGVV